MELRLTDSRPVILREGMKIEEFEKRDVTPADIFNVISKGGRPASMNA